MQVFPKRRGIVGIAIWDHGEYNQHDRHYCDLHDGHLFYRNDLRYKLREYRSVIDGLELQKESFYNYRNNGWDKIEDFSTFHDFWPFLVRNEFLALHARTRACDITSLHGPNRSWALQETRAGIDFAFRLGCDAIVLHPGSLTEQLNSDPLSGVHVNWEYGVTQHGKRQDALFSSLREIIVSYVAAIDRFKRMLDHCYRQFGSCDDLTQALKHYRVLRKGMVSSEVFDERRLLDAIIDEIGSRQLPIAFVRNLARGQEDVRLCIENVEPYNFLINVPEQHVYWLEVMRDIFYREAVNASFSAEDVDHYLPMLVVDTNHYLHSQVILQQHHELEGLFGQGFHDVGRPFVQLPGDYHEREPLLNRLIRHHGHDIRYFHVAGVCYGDHMQTHERIQPFRTHVATTEDETGKPIFRYGLANFDPETEMNLEEVLQVIGCDRTYILEVFNASSECIKNSHENVKSFLNYVASLRKLFQNRLAADTIYRLHHRDNPSLWDLEVGTYFIKAHPRHHYQRGGVGFDLLKWFRFDNSARFGYRIMATMNENQDMWVNPTP